MNSPQAFDAEAWLKKYTGNSRISAVELQPVLEFTLIWSLFEQITCKRKANLLEIRAHIDKSISKDMLDTADFSDHIKFLETHFGTSCDDDILANKLLSYGSESKPKLRVHITLLRAVLYGQDTDTGNVLFSLLFVAYRVRNNLFHGEKRLYGLHIQNDLFRTVNSILANYIENTHPNNQG